MNQTIETIIKGNGIMAYSAEQVKDDDLNLILKVGRASRQEISVITKQTLYDPKL